MDKYRTTSMRVSALVTNNYSTSFGLATKLFPDHIKQAIYSIYGYVRLVDEIVDSYDGKDRLSQLNQLYRETIHAIESGFSTNLIVQAFCMTATKYGIDEVLIKPFFQSMKMDINFFPLNKENYQKYIYGSAEVVGLMCLKVFIDNDEKQYLKLYGAAKSLGAAYQKINFLRDLSSDNKLLKRYYFPHDTYDSFSDKTKKQIISDIKKDLTAAKVGINDLPKAVQPALKTSYEYYNCLLTKLELASAKDIKNTRIRINNFKKTMILLKNTTLARIV